MSKLFDKDLVKGLIKSGLTLEDLDKYLELQEKNPTPYMKVQKMKEEQKERMADSRYNVPKEEPKSSQAEIDKAIMENEIYRKSKMTIMQAQRKQIGYGLDKYPETLNPNSWTVLETIDHIIEESVDRLHYLGMLRIQLEQMLINEAKEDKHDVADSIRYAIERLTGADLDGDKHIINKLHFELDNGPIFGDQYGNTYIRGENGELKLVDEPVEDKKVVRYFYDLDGKEHSVEVVKRPFKGGKN